jgi:hypothetical protein
VIVIVPLKPESHSSVSRLLKQGQPFDPMAIQGLVAWGEYVAGAPRIAEEVFSWSRAEVADSVSFLPTPGPGDSDGGDIY